MMVLMKTYIYTSVKIHMAFAFLVWLFAAVCCKLSQVAGFSKPKWRVK